ncbi:MAG: 4Fe-4S binding protein [Treponema sp.]|jgi:dissimilatory sulfite reductase (desulfoviridin) alpha/beta subunit|nr:4Fe-4S binding protein [Treponema sp.]
MAEVDYAALKKSGFMRQVQKDQFSLRLKVTGGQVRAEQLQTIIEAAQKYGRGYVHLTSRQGIEIPFISLEDVEAIKRDLGAAGVAVGASGPQVRTVTACQGSAVCPGGAIETTALAEELAARYFSRELPHKFKIGVTGCRNNCLKAEENDLGVKGGVFPVWEKKDCVYCGACETVCPRDAIKADKDGETLVHAESACVYCGRCVKSCPSGAMQGRNGYMLSFGGMHGNTIQEGVRLLPLLFDKEQVLKAADAAIVFFQNNARSGERLGRTLLRLGSEGLKQELEAAVQQAASSIIGTL